MGTILVYKNLKFMIHTNDHEPAHVTIYYGNPDNFEAKARIEIKIQKVMSNIGFTDRDLKLLIEVCKQRKDEFYEAWKNTRPTE